METKKLLKFPLLRMNKSLKENILGRETKLERGRKNLREVKKYRIKESFFFWPKKKKTKKKERKVKEKKKSLKGWIKLSDFYI